MIPTSLTCHDCFYAAFGRPPSTVGGVNIAVVCGGWRQAVHLSTQAGESLVVHLCWKAEQLLNKQDVAVSSYYTGPLKLYRRAGNCFGEGDLRCGRHWDTGRRKKCSSTFKLLIFSSSTHWAEENNNNNNNKSNNNVFTCNGLFHGRAHDGCVLKHLQGDLVHMPRS